MPPADGSRDFDFEAGRWQVQHRRLRERLVGCTLWEEFAGTSETRPVLNGLGNVEDNLIHFPDGDYRAIAIRSYDPAKGTWAIWWLDQRAPHRLDVPVIGAFTGGVGAFYADDTHDGTPVLVRFHWLDTASATPRWEQAMSTDAGKSWETNWTMQFHRTGD